MIFNYHNHIDIVVEGAPDTQFESSMYGAYPSVQAMMDGQMLARFRIHYTDNMTALRAYYGVPKGEDVRLKGALHIIKRAYVGEP